MEWLDFIQNNHVIHFKAPPASGKTSIAQILYWKYEKQHGEGTVAYFHFSKNTFTDFHKFWSKHYNSAKLLILDGVQKGYSDRNLELWDVVKALLAKEPQFIYLFFCNIV